MRSADSRIAITVVVLVAAVGLAGPAGAKTPAPAKVACAALGNEQALADALDVGKVSFQTWNVAHGVTFRAFKKVRRQLPRAAWTSFSKNAHRDGLHAWCATHYPDAYDAGFQTGQRIAR